MTTKYARKFVSNVIVDFSISFHRNWYNFSSWYKTKVKVQYLCFTVFQASIAEFSLIISKTIKPLYFFIRRFLFYAFICTVKQNNNSRFLKRRSSSASFGSFGKKMFLNLWYNFEVHCTWSNYLFIAVRSYYNFVFGFYKTYCTILISIFYRTCNAKN
jgi:hypothetical protein